MRILLLSLLFGALLPTGFFAQTFAISINPTAQCQSSYNTATAVVSSPASGATSYSWTVSGPCTATYTTYNSTLTTMLLPCAGVYTVTASAWSSSLISTATQTLIVYPVSLSTSGNTLICSGAAVQLTACCALSYTWYPGNVTMQSVTVSPTSTTTYTVFGQSSTGCTAVSFLTVSVAITPSIVGQSTVCAGNPIALSANPGSAAYNYTWLPSSATGTLITVTPTANTCYTLLSQAGSGCTNTAVKCVTVSASPALSINLPTVCPGTNATITASGASSYVWYTSPSTTSGTIAVFSTSNSPSSPTFAIWATGSNGCGVYSIGVIPTQTAPPLQFTVSPSATLCSGMSATIAVSGAQSYSWNPTGSNASVIVVSPTTSTNYYVTGSQTSGCNSYSVVSIFVPYLYAYATNSTLCGTQSTTLVTNTTWGWHTFSWSNGSSVISTTNIAAVTPTASGCYTLTATNTVAACSSTMPVCVNISALAFSVGGASVVCAGSSFALSPSLYPPSNFSYSWQPGGQSTYSIVTSATANTCYTLTATQNSTGCTGTAVKCITVTPAPGISVSSTAVCVGTNVTLTATGASSVSWQTNMSFVSGSATSAVMSPLTAGTFTYYALVYNGSCIANIVGTITATGGPPLSVTVSPSNTICPGSSATITVSGANGYSWSPGGATSSVIVVTPTMNTWYNVIGTQTSGCDSYTNFPVYVIQLQATASATNVCPGGTSTLSTPAGWSNHIWTSSTATISTAQTAVVNPTANTCYTVSATHIASGCQALSYACVNVTPLTFSVGISNSMGCAGNPVSLWIGGLPFGSYNYNWSPISSTNSSLTVYPTTTTCYTAIVTQTSTGCTASASACYSVFSIPVTVNGNQPVCAGQTLTLSASGASSYTWTSYNGSGFQLGATKVLVAAFGQQTIGLAVSNGTCSTYSVISLTVYPPPSLIVTGPGSTCPGQPVTLSVSGATSYVWNPGAVSGNTISVSPTSNTNYTVTGTSSLGCTAIAIKPVWMLPVPSITISGNNQVCTGSSATLVASGANSYVWSNAVTNAANVVTPAANTCYTVIGTNSSGCSGSASTCVTLLSTSISISPATATVCKYSSQTFTTSGAVSYTWSTNALTSTVNVIPLVTTSYTVTGLGSNGCLGFATVTLVVDTTCSMVWPGDANSDGVVGSTDVLEIGLAFSATGASRSNASNNYVAQFANNWSGTVSSGKNKCHADCNGSGTVNANDTVAIYNNFSLTHSFRVAGKSSLFADISLVSNNSNLIEAGTWNQLDIHLGDGNNPIDVYGLVFDLNFDQSLIETNDAYITYSSSFLNGSTQNVDFRKPAFNSGRIYAASVRTDGNDVTGSGKIGEFHFRVKPGLTFGTQLQVSVSSGEKVKYNREFAPLSGNALAVVVADFTRIQTTAGGINIHMYPNPASNEVQLRSGSDQPVAYRLTDITGRNIQSGTFTKIAALNTSELAAGAYLVEFNSGASLTVKKLIIEK
jgi:hypothetical protein